MHKIFLRYFVFILLLTIIQVSFGKENTTSLSGKITDTGGNPVSFASVLINKTQKGVSTNVEGEFDVPNIASGKYTIEVRCIGYENYSGQIVIENTGTNTVEVVLNPADIEVGEVLVTGKGKTAQTRQKAFTISAIDAEPLQNLNQDINHVLGKVTGVRIREEGGLGSGFNFSLNGFSGRQIKFFLDGVPMDYYGSSMSLNNIPINMAEQIEVYKGVVPVNLGSDALGGSVNIVTRNDVKSFVDASYSIGSFNTHRLSLLSKYVNPENGFTIGMNAFGNYSDNDYWVDVEIYDSETKAYKGIETVHRFNDAYKSGMVQFETGWQNRSFADQLLAGIIVSGNYKEIQTGVNMNQVAGQVYRTNDQFVASVKYKKEALLAPGLDVRFYSSYLDGHSLVADSSSRQYNWHGGYYVESIGTSGELTRDKSLFSFDDKSATTSSNVSYELTPQHAFVINHNYSWFRREGNDPLSPYVIPYDEPNVMNKHVFGTGYQNKMFDGRISTNIFYKLFTMDVDVVYAEWGNYEQNNQSYTRSSFGLASTWFIMPSVQLKLSYENTYRLPEVYELMGDGYLLKNNPYLKPERSRNFNAGVLWDYLSSNHHLLVEANYLYRYAEDLIRLDVAAITSQYQNLRSARVNSFEGSVRYRYKDLLNIEVNTTYQDMVNLDKKTGYYRVRIPNVPYLFCNVSAGLTFKNVGIEKSKFSMNWAVAFVEAFYLKWPNLGLPSSKYTIPRQLSHNASLAYSINGRYNISVECRNVFDRALFDNYALQKPGRSFNVKLRYFFASK
jgi:outer membrane receptor protein involved in Fe transport